jgi:hypothetical protein
LGANLRRVASVSFAFALVLVIAGLSWCLSEVTMAEGKSLNWASWKMPFVVVRTRSGQAEKATRISV